MQTVSEKIKELREAKNLSQKKLAEIAGVSQPTIYNVEHGKVDNITLKIGKKIAEALETSFTELFDNEIPGIVTSEALGELEQLRERIKDLEKRLEKETQLNSLLTKENREYKKENYIFDISDLIAHISDLSLQLYDNNSSDFMQYANDTITEETVLLSEKIKESLSERLFTKDEIIDHFLKVSRFLDLLNKKKELNEFPKGEKAFVSFLTNYLNNIFKVTSIEVGEKINEITNKKINFEEIDKILSFYKKQ